MDLNTLVAQGDIHPTVMAVFAFALGALHGFEPGHSKTIMAAYIIAIRGTALQAVVLACQRPCRTA